ncbi:hypothetical protein PZA11_007406 [Diplocarpon coronariae]
MGARSGAKGVFYRSNTKETKNSYTSVTTILQPYRNKHYSKSKGNMLILLTLR